MFTSFALIFEDLPYLLISPCEDCNWLTYAEGDRRKWSINKYYVNHFYLFTYSNPMYPYTRKSVSIIKDPDHVAFHQDLHCLSRLNTIFKRHINHSWVLVQPRKTRPYITERLLMGRKASNQTNKQTIFKDRNIFWEFRHVTHLKKTNPSL